MASKLTAFPFFLDMGDPPCMRGCLEVVSKPHLMSEAALSRELKYSRTYVVRSVFNPRDAC